MSLGSASGRNVTVFTLLLLCVISVDCDEKVRSEMEGVQRSLLESSHRVRHHHHVSKVPCAPASEQSLRKLMGEAFNPRYMSYKTPDFEPESQQKQKGSDDTPQDQQEQRQKSDPFYVNSQFSRFIPSVNDDVFSDKESSLRSEETMLEKSTQKSSYPFNPKITTKPDREETQLKESVVTEKVDAFRVRTKSVVTFKSKANTQQDEIKESDKPKGLEIITDASARFEKQEDKKLQQSGDVKDKFEKETALIPNDGIISEDDVGFDEKNRKVRSVRKPMPWMCSSEIRWTDLGSNHFPRYLRTVVCNPLERCWYGVLRCRGRAFTVKILRRKADSCVPAKFEGASELRETSGVEVDSRVPMELQEQWVFEERAVTFCCECSAS